MYKFERLFIASLYISRPAVADGNLPSRGEAYFCRQICPVAVITFVVRKNKSGEGL